MRVRGGGRTSEFTLTEIAATASRLRASSLSFFGSYGRCCSRSSLSSSDGATAGAAAPATGGATDVANEVSDPETVATTLADAPDTLLAGGAVATLLRVLEAPLPLSTTTFFPFTLVTGASVEDGAQAHLSLLSSPRTTRLLCLTRRRASIVFVSRTTTIRLAFVLRLADPGSPQGGGLLYCTQ